MGQPDLANDERFADVVSRYRHQDDLEPLIEAWTSQHHHRELMERLQAAGCPAAMVSRQPDLRDDPQLTERGFWIELDHPEVGRRPYPGPPAKFRNTPLTPTKAAPLLGEHNEDILKGVLGVSDERYQELLDAHIIGDTYLETAT
jgi:crotonobetainyl-CoA:carnitine CoA-transferase CaiB-like acyl-CoA transferase